MASVIFVHGTGVRKAGYDASFAMVRGELRAERPALDMRECRWGEHCGVTLHFGGASIPSYATARAVGAPLGSEEDLAVWLLLYDDPLYELRLLVIRGGGTKELPPGKAPPWTGLQNAVNKLAASAGMQQLLARSELAPYWPQAFTDIRSSGVTADAIKTVGAAVSEHRTAIARAMVAKTILLALDADVPPPSGELRDALVLQIVTALGGEERFVGKWVKDQLKGVASSIGTWYAKRKRGVISDASYPAAGDILLYQVRGNEIRKFIRDAIEQAADPVTLLSHSLGGIVCVDILAKEEIPKVKRLITVGSQAPLLYELDALFSCRPPSGLPAHFPPWLNIYDTRDMLSYIGEGVFGKDKVTDEQVDNGQPFPESHSAYWTNSEVWKKIVAALP